MSTRKFECIEQLFDEEICFDPKALLLSLEAYLGSSQVREALEYISRVEDWRFRIKENGEIVDSENEGDEENE
jgi:hypothetical protein